MSVYEGEGGGERGRDGGRKRETDRQRDRDRQTETESSNNLVFYAQSTIAVISGRERERELRTQNIITQGLRF